MARYIDQTKNIRGNTEFLFISFKRSFKKVISQTLSRWVKEAVKESGIDTDVFTAHSTRHASTSAAKRNGVDLDTMRKTAAWTENSKVFAKFYDLELTRNKDTFANAIYCSK